jgi:hypothetical protein
LQQKIKAMTIPSKVSIHYLMEEYDHLVTQINENGNATKIGQDSDNRPIQNNTNHSGTSITDVLQQNLKLYTNLYIVCCILLNINTKLTYTKGCSILSEFQKDQVHTTARRTFLLQQRIDEILKKEFCEFSITSLFPVFEDIVIVTYHHCNNLGTDDIFLWKYSNGNCSNDTSFMNVYHPIELTFDKDELAKEEELLYAMANTPISDHEKNNNFVYGRMKDHIREEWVGSTH